MMICDDQQTYFIYVILVSLHARYTHTTSLQQGRAEAAAADDDGAAAHDATLRLTNARSISIVAHHHHQIIKSIGWIAMLFIGYLTLLMTTQSFRIIIERTYYTPVAVDGQHVRN